MLPHVVARVRGQVVVAAARGRAATPFPNGPQREGATRPRRGMLEHTHARKAPGRDSPAPDQQLACRVERERLCVPHDHASVLGVLHKLPAWVGPMRRSTAVCAEHNIQALPPTPPSCDTRPLQRGCGDAQQREASQRGHQSHALAGRTYRSAHLIIARMAAPARRAVRHCHSHAPGWRYRPITKTTKSPSISTEYLPGTAFRASRLHPALVEGTRSGRSSSVPTVRQN